jgi:hypothetical protein
VARFVVMRDAVSALLRRFFGSGPGGSASESAWRGEGDGPGGAGDPWARVRAPRPHAPGGRSAGIALEEPGEDSMVSAIGRPAGRRH